MDEHVDSLITTDPVLDVQLVLEVLVKSADVSDVPVVKPVSFVVLGCGLLDPYSSVVSLHIQFVCS